MQPTNDRAPTVHAPGVLRVPLTKGMFALIDEADAPLIVPHPWHAVTHPTWNTSYAVGRVNGERIRMHRLIIGAPTVGCVDHIDGNGLNNMRANLRFATHAQNLYNSKIRRDNTSGFRGVSRHASSGLWQCKAMRNGVLHLIGYFTNAETAAHAYDTHIRATRGPFARLNFPDSAH